MAVQWLGFGTSTAGGPGSISGRGTEIPQAMLCSQKKKITTRTAYSSVQKNTEFKPEHRNKSGCGHLGLMRRQLLKRLTQGSDKAKHFLTKGAGHGEG